MNRQDRAKQFAPFEALKGLREALAEREFENEKLRRHSLPEEEALELQEEIIKLKKGDIAEIVCFERGRYITVTGMLTKKDMTFKYLVIGEGKIHFNDIYKLTII